MDPIHHQGHVFHGPDGQGYRLKRDVFPLEAVTVEQFEPFGGAPEPEPNNMMPNWLAKQVLGVNE